MNVHGCKKKKKPKCNALPGRYLTAEPKPGESEPCPLLSIFLDITEGWLEVTEVGEKPQPTGEGGGEMCSNVDFPP